MIMKNTASVMFSASGRVNWSDDVKEKAVLGFFRIRRYILNCSTNWNLLS